MPEGLGANIFRILTAFVLLVVPSALMGATYPALCQSLIHSAKDVDARLGWIYGLNTLGAAAGALGAGFVMIELLGSRGSVTAANAINLTVGGVALLLARKEKRRTRGAGIPPSDESIPSQLPIWVAGVVLFGSGFATLGYEIVWFRALRYLMGNGTYVLSTALVIFLTGLGLGGVFYRVALRIGKPEWNLGISQLMIAMLALIAILGEQWVLIHPDLKSQVSGFDPVVNSLAWQTRLGIAVGIAVVTMLPATIWMGLTFPLASRLFLGTTRGLSSRVGLAYLISNLGSIAGAILAATWILPSLGTVDGTTFLAGVNVLLGLLVLSRAPMRPYRVLAILLVVATVGIAARMPDRLAFSFQSKYHVLLYEKEGDLGTVQVHSHKGRPDSLGMLIDGIAIGATEAFNPVTYSKQQILVHLPMVLDRSIRQTLNLGVASGSTAKTLSRYPWVTSLDSVEINPAVIEAGAFFFDTTALRDPRASLYVEDAVHYLLRTDKRYDLIINDAKQDPRFGGNAKILSTELYRYSLAALNECGLFVQFLPLEGHPESLKLILRTFISVFPESEFFIESASILISVGSRCPIGGREGPTREDLQHAGVAEEIESLYVPDATYLPTMWAASGSELASVIGDGPVNSWDRLPLEFLSYRLPASDPEELATVHAMLSEPRVTDPKGDLLFTDNPYFPALRELQIARLEWAQLKYGQANRRVDRVLEEHPDLGMAKRTKRLVRTLLKVQRHK